VRVKLDTPAATIAVCAALLATTALALWLMDQPLWCAGGEPWLWSGNVWSRHNSQHLFDPYTVSHLSHGLLLALVLRPWCRGRRAPTLGLVIATALEAAWEVLENTDAIIRRYREATMSLEYFGDSIANVLGDVLAMMLGYLATVPLSTRVALAAFAALEIALALWIRDGLVLNVLMLVVPIDAVKQWQLGVGAS
jgi:hypothetical protein